MQDNPQYDAFISQYRTVLITLWMVTSATALFTYEYFITLGAEISEMWLRKWTSATWLYMLNRYVAVASSFLQVRAKVYKPTCGISDGGFTVFSGLRVYALWNRNIQLGLTVLLLALVPMGVNIYNDTTYILVFVPSLLPQPVCGNAFGISQSLVFRCAYLTLVTRLTAMLADILVLVATWMKTWVTYKEGLRAGLKVPIASLLIRDGTLYFMALLLMNVYQIIGNTSPALALGDSGTIYISVLTPMLISRFLLNLRRVSLEVEDEALSTTSRFSALQFRHPVSLSGNAGGLCSDGIQNVCHSEEDIPMNELTLG
ncbi:hypothetical protein BC835DRAFT_1418437 [Cytidiella melzeri]|nr:hypothetical protein BC835DRAFT_1418437 [Cytidiella melzeri]